MFEQNSKTHEDTLDDICLTHEELQKVTKSTLNELFRNDVVIRDLPQDVTLEEVDAQIAVLHGRSMTVFIVRNDNDVVPVIVSKFQFQSSLHMHPFQSFIASQVKQSNSTVSDLKRAFQRAMLLKLRREGETCKISWKHIWRVYLLSYDGVKLESDHKLLKDYGIANKSEIVFVPKIKEKNLKQFGK